MVKKFCRLACKFGLDQSERKSSQINASAPCVNLRLRLARALHSENLAEEFFIYTSVNFLTVINNHTRSYRTHRKRKSQNEQTYFFSDDDWNWIRKICRLWYAFKHWPYSRNDANKFLPHWCYAMNYESFTTEVRINTAIILQLRCEKASKVDTVFIICQENHTMWLQVNHQPEMRCYTPLLSDPPKIEIQNIKIFMKYFYENKWTKTCETQK